MSIYTKVVSTRSEISSIHVPVEGTMHKVGVVYGFIDGERKKIWPDANPTTDPTVEYTTPGTYTITLPAGYYKFSMSGAGGGAAVSYKGSGSANMGGTLAGGGSGAYGYFELMLNTQETFTFKLGSGGTGRAGGGTQAGDAGTVTTVSSNLRGTFVTLNAGTGGSTYWDTTQSRWYSPGSGGSYSTTLASHHLNAGSNGSGEASAALAREYWGSGGNNPDPYKGDGGTAHFYKSNGLSNLYANSGQSAWVKIEPAVQYIYLTPTTTSITLDPGTYYFEIVGGGGGGLGVLGASDYAYGNGGSGASGFGYFTVDTRGVYNVQCGSGGAANSSEAGVTSQGTFVSGNGTASYIIRAADNFNVVTCEGGTGVSWHYNGHGTAEYWFNYYGTGGTASTSLSGNYTLANGANGSGTYSHADNMVNYPNTLPTYFSVYGQGGFARRLTGITHQGGAGGSGMLKIYKYS